MSKHTMTSPTSNTKTAICGQCEQPLAPDHSCGGYEAAEQLLVEALKGKSATS